MHDLKHGVYKRTFAPGEIVFREGEWGNSAYLVEQGKVEVITGKNLDIQLNILGPGALVGEMAILDHAPRSATVRALLETELTEIPQEALSERLDAADPVVRLLFRVLLKRLRNLVEKVGGENGNAKFMENQQHISVAQGLDKMRLENELRDALDRRELEVYYQPIFGILEQRWVGFEGLVRWNHPRRGLIYPSEFIAVAEETNLIRPLGARVLLQAADAHRDFCIAQSTADTAAEPLFISVNVSARQISDPGFAVLLDVVTPSSSCGIKLEITETLVVDYVEVKRFIAEAKQRGFSLAMDDFGTGYSGFQHLLELDFDTVKIDQAFVMSMLDSERSHQLVQSIVEIARKLNLTVIAEGVETQQQLDALRVLGVDFAQGFLISRAMTRGAVIHALRGNA